MSEKEDIFSRLYDKRSYTGMYAERFAPDNHHNLEAEIAHAFELRPSMNTRIQTREMLASSPPRERPKIEKNASVMLLLFFFIL